MTDERAIAGSGFEHAQTTGHSVTEAVDEPWHCLVCPARSLAYELTIFRADGGTPQ